MFSRKAARQKVSNSKALPAPTGGLNDFDPISAMDPSFLLECTNFYPDTGLLVVRPGYQEWAKNLGAAVETIIDYSSSDGTTKRFAATSNGIYDITVPTASPALVHAATNGYWEGVNFSNAGGQYLVIGNGHDPAVFFNGSTWTQFTSSASPANPGEIKDLAPTDIASVHSHMGRLWFVKKNSMEVWYLPVDSLGGIAKPLKLGGIFRKGGYIVAIARWSADTGEGLDDRLVIVSSKGEVASYSGYDPDDASTFSLDSVFYVAAPLSKRSLAEFGGDLLLLCKQGMVPLSTLVTSVGSENIFSRALTRRISRSLMRIASTTSPPFPAEVVNHSDAGWVMINIYNGSPDVTSPYGMILGEGERPIQFVMNQLTGAWGKFDYPVRTLKSTEGLLFMGTEDGRVVVVTPNVHVDDIKMDSTGGSPIVASAMGAYTYLDMPNANKHAKLIRPVFQTEIKPSFVAKVLSDFRLDRLLDYPASSSAVGNAAWDLANWDTSAWASLENAYRPWVSANSLGYAFAWQIRVNTASALGISSMGWVWENGGYV